MANKDKRNNERSNCSGIVMFRVLSDDLNSAYCADRSYIRGTARAINMSDEGLMMKMVDMVGLTDVLHGFSFGKLEGVTIELGRPDTGKLVKAQIRHVSGNDIGVKYI